MNKINSRKVSMESSKLIQTNHLLEVDRKSSQSDEIEEIENYEQENALFQEEELLEDLSGTKEELINRVIDHNEHLDSNNLDVDEYENDIASTIESDLTEDNEHLFHFNFIRNVIKNTPISCNEKKYKNGTRKSLTFTNERMREIERHNQILLNKILDKGPNSIPTSKKNSSTSVNSSSSASRISSAALNRKKQQRQIDYENQILNRKLMDIYRKRKAFN